MCVDVYVEYRQLPLASRGGFTAPHRCIPFYAEPPRSGPGQQATTQHYRYSTSLRHVVFAGHSAACTSFRGARLSSGRGSGGRPRRAGRVRPRRRPRCLRRRAASCPAGGGCASKYVRKWIVATHYVREALAQLTSSTNLQPKYALLHRIAHHEAHLQHVEVSRRGVVSSEP